MNRSDAVAILERVLVIDERSGRNLTGCFMGYNFARQALIHYHGHPAGDDFGAHDLYQVQASGAPCTCATANAARQRLRR